MKAERNRPEQGRTVGGPSEETGEAVRGQDSLIRGPGTTSPMTASEDSWVEGEVECDLKGFVRAGARDHRGWR